MPTEMVNAAKDEMDSYAFLNWLVPHIRMRRTKRDLNVMELSGMMEVKREFYGSDECGSSFDEQETFDEEGEMENASMVSSSANHIKIPGTPIPFSQQQMAIPSPTSEQHHHSSAPPPPLSTTTNGVITNGELKRKSNEILTVKTDGSGASVYKKARHGYYSSPNYVKGAHGRKEEIALLDDIDLFGKMIAAEIKQLPARDQCIAKHQIHTVLFELKMSHFSQASSQWQPPQPVYVVSGGGVPPPSHRSHESRVRSGGYRDPYYPADSSLKESND